MKPAVVYDHRYNIGFWATDRLHPFDTRKYGRAWKLLGQQYPAELARAHVRVDRPVSDDELSRVHTPNYLKSLQTPAVIARAVELPLLQRIPLWLLHRWLLQPMRWATRGTFLACRAALEREVAVNLGGGFHHAKRDRGEGFSLFADIPLAVSQLREHNLIASHDRIAYIDLDAHQGNGVSDYFAGDTSVFIFDMYNAEIYPSYDRAARERVDCDLPLRSGCSGTEYLRLLRERLPPFLDSISRTGRVALAIYNAGTDVLRDDPLGRLSLTEADVLERDQFVIAECRRRSLPLSLLTSGGYTRESYRLIAATVAGVLQADNL
jgi:histone deacetylase 11